MFYESKTDNSKIKSAIENKQIKYKREVKPWNSQLMKNLLLRSTLLIYAAWQTTDKEPWQ